MLIHCLQEKSFKRFPTLHECIFNEHNLKKYPTLRNNYKVSLKAKQKTKK